MKTSLFVQKGDDFKNPFTLIMLLDKACHTVKQFKVDQHIKNRVRW
ncbi:MAG TPA: hypothetical protein VMT12_00080 [Syntrophales bacterium]|nr:hypothetical protein [Syntrophales bacterium]